MTTSKLSPNLGDLASFEPEAILASLPGEHPRMAAGLAIGRQASEGGHLDVAALSRIVNEIYAEGFPDPSALAGFAGVPATPEFPSTASLTHAVNPGVGDVHGLIPPALPPTAELPGASTNNYPGYAKQGENHIGGLHALQLEYAPGLPYGQGASLLDVSQLFGGIDIPQVPELQGFPGSSGTHVPHSGASGSSPMSVAPASAAPAGHGFYFLQEQGPVLHVDPRGVASVPVSVPGASYPGTPASSSTIASSAHPPFDANLIRRDFPILSEQVNGRSLIWLDNAATTQKPQCVIDRISYFYQHENSNIHRAAHELAARATDAYEGAREKVRHFINAPSVDNIVFVRGTTEAINLVAKTWGKKHLRDGDEIVITNLEHHANIVPWQQLCLETGAKLRVAPVDDSGQVRLDEYQKLLTSRTKLVSFTQVSNALGTVTPAQEMIAMAHRVGAKVLLDAAQSVSHMRVDVQALDPDFLVFSGHKVFGPTGIGALYGKQEVLDDMPAWQRGGNMIQDVTFDKTVYHEAPAKFEAGTGNIADAVGMGAALDYVGRIGMENIARYEHELLEYGTESLLRVPGLRLIGTAREKASVLSFSLHGFKSEEVGAALNKDGIAVRSGHHCAQPILRRFGVETTVRPSLAFYNTHAEIDVLQASLLRLVSGKI